MSRTSSGRASLRSILFMITSTGRPASKVFLSTNRVWGKGPSDASTSKMAESAMERARSTSPPKSAWPGVSIILIFMPLQVTEPFLAAMVMPRSRSRSIESMSRSSTSWPSRNIPLCLNMASTSVVFPWSTWAIMATFLSLSFTALFFFIFSCYLDIRVVPSGAVNTRTLSPGNIGTSAS